MFINSDWIHLAQDRDQWQALVNTAIIYLYHCMNFDPLPCHLLSLDPDVIREINLNALYTLHFIMIRVARDTSFHFVTHGKGEICK